MTGIISFEADLKDAADFFALVRDWVKGIPLFLLACEMADDLRLGALHAGNGMPLVGVLKELADGTGVLADGGVGGDVIITGFDEVVPVQIVTDK